MSKTIVVVGASGAQGGSVARKFLEDKWKVRAITRNANSKSAEALVSIGAEVVVADTSDEASLVKAFEGAHAIFANTNFWEHISKPPYHAVEAGKNEHSQAINLANAAAKIKTLQHYIWSSIPHSPEAYDVPHFNSKAETDIYICEKLPELAAKTTYLWLGYYPSNIAYFPFIKPIPMLAPAPHIFMQSVPSKTVTPSAGDVTINTGLFVSAIVAQPELTLPGKYAIVWTENITLGEQLKIWSEVTGKAAEYVQVDEETFIRVWGAEGGELNLNWKMFVSFPNWLKLKPGILTGKDLGIEDKLIGTRQTLEALKPILLA